MSDNDDNPGLLVLAVDDEPHSLSMLVEVLNADPRVKTVLHAESAEEALTILRPANRPPPQVDALFLDMRMPGMDGRELANAATKDLPNPPAIVFATAFDGGAIDAFELGVADYLMKPVTRERVASAIRRIIAARREASAPGSERSGEDEVIPVELAGTTKLVPRSSVRWVEAHGDYARLHTGEGGGHLVRIPLSQLEDRWSDAGFVRIHRSYLVALPLVTELRMSSSGYVVRVGSGEDATELPVSRRHTRDLKDRLVRAAKQGWTTPR